MAITLAAARMGAILGNLAFGGLVDVACAVPILLVAALLIGISSTTMMRCDKCYSRLCVMYRWWSFRSAASQHNERTTSLNPS